MIGPKYLGDGVYVRDDINYHQLILTTGNHLENEATNVIYLEEEVLQSLLEYINNLKSDAPGGGRGDKKA